MEGNGQRGRGWEAKRGNDGPKSTGVLTSPSFFWSLWIALSIFRRSEQGAKTRSDALADGRAPPVSRGGYRRLAPPRTKELHFVVSLGHFALQLRTLILLAGLVKRRELLLQRLLRLWLRHLDNRITKQAGQSGQP